MNIEKVFIASYERTIGEGVGITERGQVFFRRFYENFLASSDRVKEKFASTDMEQQQRVLQKGVYQLISFYLTKSDSQLLRDIARSHDKRHYDIESDLYDMWLESLIATVAEMDSQYDSDLELAWRIVMTPGILYMKHYYSLPGPEGEGG